MLAKSDKIEELASSYIPRIARSTAVASILTGGRKKYLFATAR